jgi:Ca2+/H+ antiporter, TMEM165/GDT1 family
LNTLIISTLAVAIAEIGDKTQLLALVLAARFRRPWAVIAGIFVATLLNHALAGWVGAWVADWIGPELLRWLLAASFLAVAAWTLVPDTLDANAPPVSARGAFIATTLAFFLVEMGDKTQVATVVLAATYDPLWQVVAGSTLGMLLANAPVVVLGQHAAPRLPLHYVRWVAAAFFTAIAAWIAWQGLPG